MRPEHFAIERDGPLGHALDGHVEAVVFVDSTCRSMSGWQMARGSRPCAVIHAGRTAAPSRPVARFGSPTIRMPFTSCRPERVGDRRRRQQVRPYRALAVLLTPISLLLGIAFLIPLGTMVVYSFLEPGLYGGVVWAFYPYNYGRLFAGRSAPARSSNHSTSESSSTR